MSDLSPIIDELEELRIKNISKVLDIDTKLWLELDTEIQHIIGKLVGVSNALGFR